MMDAELNTESVIKEMGHIIDIRGGMDYILLNFENNYIMKAYGELRRNTENRPNESSVYFLVYKSSMTKWQPPHEDIIVNKPIIDAIIHEVLTKNNPESVTIKFS